MRLASMLLAGSLAFAASQASAVVVLSDNFDAEGGTTLNYNGFANWDVLDGTVDLLADPNDYGIGCAGGGGSCVDLDGSTGDPGILITKLSFTVALEDSVNLTFDASGNQRGGFDSLVFGLLFDDGDIIEIPVGPLGSADPFTTYGASGSVGRAGTFRLFFRADPDGPGSDNTGLILDNVNLDITATGVVPEPASWAMMIAGFGLVGGALRRRGARAAAVA